MNTHDQIQRGPLVGLRLTARGVLAAEILVGLAVAPLALAYLSGMIHLLNFIAKGN